jgi:DNA-binding NtrC family response regulator
VVGTAGGIFRLVGDHFEAVALPPAAVQAGVAAPTTSGPATFDASLLKPGLGFKGAKQTVVDAFEAAYLEALMARNDGNITRSAHEAGLTRYHLRELLKRHGIKGGEQE